MTAHDIAVVGVSCRFPGDADSPERFWSLIRDGRSAYSENHDRWNPDAFHYPQKKLNTSLPRGAHFLKEDLAVFDANYFNISKAEAEAMDPQQRMVMEATVEAMDQGGLSAYELSGTQTGVWMANFTSDYREMLYRDPETAPMYTLSGASNTSTSNRISYFMNFKGPSLTLNTACSSSLVGAHMACQSLALGETSTAVVGGTSLLLNPDLFMFLSNQNFLAPDGRCKAFDERGDGYGRGEGAAVVILKRVEDAIAHGDPIRAVIRGSAVNQDGRTKGMTLPNGDAQVQLIEQAYRSGQLDMAETRYVEAHGTGTKAGDTTETEALSRTLSKFRSPSDRLLIGSVKANIGHLEACAGLASLIKCVGILETGYIPPNANYQRGNPGVQWEDWNLRVPTALVRWPTNGLRRISTQGFGYGGTNAHLVLDDAYHYLQSRGLSGNHYTAPFEAESTPTTQIRRYSHEVQRVFYLSAHDRDGLTRLRTSLSQHLSAKVGKLSLHEEYEYLRDLEYTLSHRRTRLQWRTFVNASSLAGLSEALQEDPWPNAELRSPSKTPRIGFVFTGQGAQWAEMGTKLTQYEVFKRSVEKSAQIVNENLGCDWDVMQELSRPSASSQLGGAVFSQTLCTVLQVALVDLLASWNIHPSAVAGHSSGEIGAAYCLGVLSQQDAVKIAYYRGALSAEMKQRDPTIRGAMMAVGASPADVKRYTEALTKGVAVVACVNSPSSVTASGDEPAIEELEARLKEEGVFARKLKVDTAYHSPHMRVVAAEYFDSIADVSINAARTSCSMHSSVVGRSIHHEELGAGNWVRNLVSTVQFADAIHDMVRPLGEDSQRATDNAVDLLVEVGPHAALEGPAMQTLQTHAISGVEYMSVLKRGKDDVQMALSCVGRLLLSDVPIDLRSVHQEASAKPLVDLPTYPWNHSSRFWAESRVSREYRLRQHPRLPLLGAPCPTMGVHEKKWRGNIRMNEEPWVRDHVIQDAIVYPAAGFLAMAIEAAVQRVFDEEGSAQNVTGIRIRDVKIDAALVLEEDSVPEVILTFRPHLQGTLDSASSWTEFAITSSTDRHQLVQNCSGLLMVERDAAEASPMQLERTLEARQVQERLFQQRADCTASIDVPEFYSQLAGLGLQYGPAFAKLTSASHDSSTGSSVGSLEIPAIESMNPLGRDRDHIMHPAVLDCILHLAFAAMVGQPSGLTAALVPTSIEEVFISTGIPFAPQTKLDGLAHSSAFGLREWVSNIDVFHPDTADTQVRIRGLHLADISGPAETSDESVKPITFVEDWMPCMDLLNPRELQHTMEAAAFLSESHKEECESRVAGLEPHDVEELLQEGMDFGQLLLDTAGWHGIKNQLNEYLTLLQRQNPELSLLEIGFPTGKAGPVSLVAQLPNSANILENVDMTYSVPNKGMIDAASGQFGSSKSRVTFRDRTEESNDQRFDVVLVFSPDPTLTAESVKELLKPGGRVCVLEIKHLGTALATVLDSVSWERAPDCVTWTDNFEKIGLATQFTSSGLVEPAQLRFTLAGEETKPDSDTLQEEYVLVETTDANESQKAMVDQLEALLNNAAIRTSRVPWNAELSALEGKACIILTDLDKAMLRDISPDDFHYLQQVIVQAESLLWVSGEIGPDASLVSGLARSIRNEIPGMQFGILEMVDSPLESFPAAIDQVLRTSTLDSHFRIVDGKISISRVLEDGSRNEALATSLGQIEPKTKQTALKDAPGPIKLCVKNPGMLDSMCFEPDNIPETPLKEGEVEIDVKGSGINFRDVMVAMGQIPDTLLGFEGAGVVRRVAASVTNVKPGDRVCFLAHGAHRTVHRIRADYAVPIPPELPFAEAAGLLLAHATAWYGLIKMARVQKGQTILIHAAAGGVGQAAIMLSQHIGLEIYATVGSSDKRQLIQNHYGIPDDHIFNSRDLSFAQGVMRMTGGVGVDVVLNSLSGEALRQTWTCIAPFGMFIEIGMKDILGNTRLDMRPFIRDATFSFINLNHLERDRPQVMSEVLHRTMDLVKAGATRSIHPVTTYSVSQVEESFRLMQAGKHRGKLTLSYDDDAVVPMVSPAFKSAQLSGDGCYLLVGGLGGLGRSLSKLFVRLGAKKLCFLSRSGAGNDSANRLLDELQGQSVETLVCKCDVSDPQAVAGALEHCTTRLGPVRGVVQCAMVLRDGLFEKMSYQQWRESTEPKVQGSWNLHMCLPDVDFFLILSSFAGVFGSRGQSNYAAAGAYEDALSAYRRSRGLKGVTLDLGIMRDVGVLAEQGITDYLREWEGPCGIRENEFHALIDHTLAVELTGSSTVSQIATGFATARTVQESGINPPFYFTDPRFSVLARAGVAKESSADSSAGGTSVQTQLTQAQSPAEAAAAITGVLVRRIIDLLQIPASEIDTARPLHAFGIDSLVAVELANYLFKQMRAKVTVFDLLANVAISALAEKLVTKSSFTSHLV